MMHLSLPLGSIRTIAPIQVSDDSVVVGVGPASCVQCLGDFPAFSVKNDDGSKAKRVRIATLRITRTNTQVDSGPAQSSSYGIEVWGDDVVIEDVWIDDCYSAVRTEDHEEDPSANVTLRRVHCRHSHSNAYTSIFGFWFDTVDGLLVEDCTSRNTWLDGLKLRRLCSNVRVIGGSYNASLMGDGIDAYASGGSLTLRDVTCDDHVFGSGINIKVSDLTGAWGHARKITIDNCKARRNETVGLVVNRDAEFAARPHAAHIRITGGDYSDNNCSDASTCGAIDIDARSVELDGVLATGNRGPGLWIRPSARDVRIRGGRFAANGASGTGLPSNVIIDGQRVVLDHPVLLGKDGDDIAGDAEFDALDAVTSYGVLCQTTAADVTISLRASDCLGHAVSPLICSGPNSGKITVHAEGDGAPGGVWGGSTGSTYHRRDGGAGTSFYVKESGPANDSTGWRAV